MTGKVMLVTGTSKGIGRFLVERYIAEGWTVVGCSRSPLEGAPIGYRHFCLDVSDERAVVEMVRKVASDLGRIDALVNNAGIASMNHLLLTPLATVEKVFRTNVYGTFTFCREVGKLMVRANYGRIVNFATVATPLRLEGEAVYAASKAAVESFTRILARELGSRGITVNALGSTPVDTDLVRGVPADKMRRLLDRQAINRMGTMEDVANVVDFFLRDDSAFVTGQILYLGGVG
jgi:3-oxoacyl-[acyl-carrier protein] reductase